MNEYLNFLTPLDSSQLEVFFRIFWDFFIFLNSNLKFEFGPACNWPVPEPVRTSYRGNRTGSGWGKNPAHNCRLAPGERALPPPAARA